MPGVPAAVDGEAVVEGEEGFAVAEGGTLAQPPELVRQVSQMATEVGLATVDL